jgi:hypothetical protein
MLYLVSSEGINLETTPVQVPFVALSVLEKE